MCRRRRERDLVCSWPMILVFRSVERRMRCNIAGSGILTGHITSAETTLKTARMKPECPSR